MLSILTKYGGGQLPPPLYWGPCIITYYDFIHISVEHHDPFGELRGNFEKWTILRSEIDIEEICPSSYSGLFIKCTSKNITKWGILTEQCEPLRPSYSNVKNLETHGLVIWIWKVDRSYQSFFDLRFDTTFAVILQSWLMYEYFRKRQKPNEKWMKMWCIISFFDAVVSFTIFIQI